MGPCHRVLVVNKIRTFRSLVRSAPQRSSILICNYITLVASIAHGNSSTRDFLLRGLVPFLSVKFSLMCWRRAAKIPFYERDLSFSYPKGSFQALDPYRAIVSLRAFNFAVDFH